MKKPVQVRHLHQKFPLGEEIRQLRDAFEQLATNASPPGRIPRLYRLGTLSAVLDIPKGTLRLLISKGEIPAFRIMSRIYVSETDVVRWLTGIGVQVIEVTQVE